MTQQVARAYTLSVRTLASHELVLLMSIVERMLQDRTGLPISLENDGLLSLTRTAEKDWVLSSLDRFLRAQSMDLLGLEIPLP